jgi:hypothetical protein
MRTVNGGPRIGTPVHGKRTAKRLPCILASMMEALCLPVCIPHTQQARTGASLAGFLLPYNQRTTNMTTNTEQTSNKKVNDAIASVAKTGKAFETAVQKALVAIHAHKAEFGDWSGFKRLLEVMPKGARSNSVKAWIEQTTNVRFGQGKDVAMDKTKPELSTALAAKLAWQDADGVEKAYKGLDWTKQAEKLLEKLQSDIDHGMASLESLEGLITGLQVGLIAKKQAALAVAANAEAMKIAA